MYEVQIKCLGTKYVHAQISILVCLYTQRILHICLYIFWNWL